MNFKLGRKPRIFNPAMPHMSALIRRAAFIPLPDAVDYASKLPDDSGMMLNNKIGDCTCAAFYHGIQVWSSWTNPDGLVITEPDLDVLMLYEQACGYDPKDPTTDQGGVEQDLLAYLMTKGAPTGPKGKTRHRLRAAFEVDVRHLWDVRRAIYETGLVYTGFYVPRSILPNSGEPPVIWDVGGDQTILGGHAIILTGYNEDGFNLISWGKKYFMTTEFFSRFTEEVYALIDIDWVQGTGKTLLGMTVPELKDQMKAFIPVKGGDVVGGVPV